jgi:hypothetical protein
MATLWLIGSSFLEDVLDGEGHGEATIRFKMV